MKENFLFLGFAIPENEMKRTFTRDTNPTVQTHKFNWNLIKGMEACDTCDFTYVSARPVSDYPYYPEKQIMGNEWTLDILGKKITISELSYSNSSLLKIITRFFSGIYVCFRKYHKIKNKGGIIVYSVHLPFMMIGYLLSKLYKIDFITIWTDPPSVPSGFDSRLKKNLRSIELFISKHLMKKASKVIALTKYLAEDFAPGKPYIVVEGIIDENEINRNINCKENRSDNDIKVVYTGSLDRRYGVCNIVDGIIMLNNKDVKLEIYGRGDYEDELSDICSKHSNIRYMGYTSNDNILMIQRNADFLINARSASDEFVKYSFPSKTLEYMLSGTPLITTMLPGIPDGYRDYVIILNDNKPETICDTIKSVQGLSSIERQNIGMKAQDFACAKNYINQGKRIVNFILSKNI